MDRQHWIVTNREVEWVDENGTPVERVIKNHKREPLPTFRVARLGHDVAGKDADDLNDVVNAVEFIPDQLVDSGDYEDIHPEEDPETLIASRRMFLSLYQRMCAAPKNKGDVLVFIHGFNYDWRSAICHLMKLHQQYVVPDESPIDQIIYFTWPSHGDQRRYKKDQQIAQPSGALLGRFFAKTLAFYEAFFDSDKPADFCGRRIHLAAHSMGNQVLEEFMRSINQYEFLRQPILGEVLLLHADADWTALEPGRPLNQLHEYAERVHVYNHQSDDALSISERTKNREKRLGRHGPRDLRQIPPRTLVVDTTGLHGFKLKENETYLKALARILGISKGSPSLKERIIDHWGYLHREEVRNDIYHVLRGESSSRIENRVHACGPLFKLKG